MTFRRLIASGFATVNVSEVVPFCGMVAAPNTFAAVGGRIAAPTVSEAVLLVAPGPLWSAVIGPEQAGRTSVQTILSVSGLRRLHVLAAPCEAPLHEPAATCG